MFAIIGSVIAIIQVVDYQDMVSKVEGLVGEAQATPDLRAEIGTERGMIDFHHIYIKSTQPDFPSSSAPAPAADDPWFRVTLEDGNLVEISQSIQLKVGDANQTNGLSVLGLVTRLHGGWFVPTTTYLDDANSEVEEESLSLSIPFLDWNGDLITAWRSGDTFVIPQVAADGTIGDSFVTEELNYLDENGARRSASILIDGTPPEIQVSVTGDTYNGSGWFVSDVTVEWTVEDPETEVTGISGCDLLVVTVDGIHSFTCEGTSPGGTSTLTEEVMRDTQPPSVTVDRQPPANAHGWNNTDVIVTHNCEDAGSGIADCPEQQTVSHEGLQILTPGTARDVAGHGWFGTTLSISIDKTLPDVSINIPAHGASFVVGQSVNASWMATDTLSEIETTTATVENGSPINTAAEGDRLFTVTAVDKAGNETTVTHDYKVLTPAQASEQLQQTLAELNVHHGVAKSLKGKLDNIIARFSDGKRASALRALKAFINQVKAQSGKKIEQLDAEMLIATAQTLIDAVKP